MIFNQITIIGLGLIGGSLASAVKKRKLVNTVVAFDENNGSLTSGLEQNIIDRAESSISKAIVGSDLVVIAVPVLSVESVLSELINFTGIITDVGSVKKPIISAAIKLFGELPVNLVPGHPIAGSEKHGVAASNPDLFEQHKVILTPSDNSDKEAVEKLQQLWQGLDATVMQMTPEHHDNILAQTSHLPHLLAYALVDTLSSQGDSLEIFQYAAGGFRDFSRIAASDPVMWRDIFSANSEQVLSILDKYVTELAGLRTMIEQNDMTALETVFKRAKVARDHFSDLEHYNRNP